MELFHHFESEHRKLQERGKEESSKTRKKAGKKRKKISVKYVISGAVPRHCPFKPEAFVSMHS